jgi:hypothetical protein
MTVPSRPHERALRLSGALGQRALPESYILSTRTHGMFELD